MTESDQLHGLSAHAVSESENRCFHWFVQTPSAAPFAFSRPPDAVSESSSLNQFTKAYTLGIPESERSLVHCY